VLSQSDKKGSCRLNIEYCQRRAERQEETKKRHQLEAEGTEHADKLSDREERSSRYEYNGKTIRE
jgi:hypothetical protein